VFHLRLQDASRASQAGDLIWEDLVKAGKNWDLTPEEALRNLEETAKVVNYEPQHLPWRKHTG